MRDRRIKDSLDKIIFFPYFTFISGFFFFWFHFNITDENIPLKGGRWVKYPSHYFMRIKNKESLIFFFRSKRKMEFYYFKGQLYTFPKYFIKCEKVSFLLFISFLDILRIANLI